MAIPGAGPAREDGRPNHEGPLHRENHLAEHVDMKYEMSSDGPLEYGDGRQSQEEVTTLEGWRTDHPLRPRLFILSKAPVGLVSVPIYFRAAPRVSTPHSPLRFSLCLWWSQGYDTRFTQVVPCSNAQ